MSAPIDLEEAIDFGLGEHWGIRDGNAIRSATIGGKPVRFIVKEVEREPSRASIAHALDGALLGPLAADAVSELSSWTTEANVSVRRVESIGVECRFTGVDEDVEIMVDAAIDRLLSGVAL